MLKERAMEFVVIVKLSDDFTKRLNIYQGKEGLQIQGFNELNSNHSQLHSVINYRIFYAKNVSEHSTYKITFGNPMQPEYQKEFTIPSNQEYLEIFFAANGVFPLRRGNLRFKICNIGFQTCPTGLIVSHRTKITDIDRNFPCAYHQLMISFFSLC